MPARLMDIRGMGDVLFAVVYLGGLGFAGSVLAVAAGPAVLPVSAGGLAAVVALSMALIVLAAGEDGGVFAGLFLFTNVVGLVVGAGAGALLRALRRPGWASP
jgi:hypothetical protein